MVKAFVDVFPQAALLSGYSTELVLIGTRSPGLVLDLDRVEQKIKDDPRIAADLVHIEMGSLTELVGTFVGGPETLRRATLGAQPLTDDRPGLEYSLLDFVSGKGIIIPSSLFELTGLPEFCPKCFEGGVPTARVAWLADYQRALDRVYKSKNFVAAVEPIVVDMTGLSDTINRSAYLRNAFGAKVKAQDVPGLRDRVAKAPGDAQAHIALAFALLAAGATDEALAEQQKGVALTPDDPEGHYNLAILLTMAGRSGDGLDEAEKAVRLAPDHAGANNMLCQALGDLDPRKKRACQRAEQSGDVPH
jgi:tetratricopeptide (TPR) repeat protein